MFFVSITGMVPDNGLFTIWLRVPPQGAFHGRLAASCEEHTFFSMYEEPSPAGLGEQFIPLNMNREINRSATTTFWKDNPFNDFGTPLITNMLLPKEYRGNIFVDSGSHGGELILPGFRDFLLVFELAKGKDKNVTFTSLFYEPPEEISLGQGPIIQ